MIILCLPTYGRNPIRHNGTLLQAWKLGYSGGQLPILKTLLGDQVHDVSPSRASYHYVTFNDDAPIRISQSSYIELVVTDAQLQSVEAITRKLTYTQVYRWLDDQWQMLPSSTRPDYRPATTRSGYTPSHRPKSLEQPPAPAETAAPARTEVTITFEKHYSHKAGYWWFTGKDLAHHYEPLIFNGAAWHRKRQCHYYVGDRLNDGLQGLIQRHQWTVVGAPTPVVKPTASLNASRDRWIVSGTLSAQQIARHHLSPLGEQVYSTPHMTGELLTDLTLDWRPPQDDDPATLFPDWLNRHVPAILSPHDQETVVYAQLRDPDNHYCFWVSSLDGESVYGYERQQGSEQWARQTLAALNAYRSPDDKPLQRTLSFRPCTLKAALDSHNGSVPVQIPTHVPPVSPSPWKRDTPSTQHKFTVGTIVYTRDAVHIKRPGGEDLTIPANSEGSIQAQTHASGATPQYVVAFNAHEPVVVAEYALTIFCPKVDKTPPSGGARGRLSSRPNQRQPKHHALPAEPVGMIGLERVHTNLLCLGAALHDNLVIYLHAAGARDDTQALRSRLNTGKPCTLHRDNDPTMTLSSGGKSMYVQFTTYIKSQRTALMILVHKTLLQPQTFAYVIETDEAQRKAKFREFLNQHTPLPFQDDWLDRLWDAGKLNGLIVPTQGFGIRIHALHTSRERWMDTMQSLIDTRKLNIT